MQLGRAEDIVQGTMSQTDIAVLQEAVGGIEDEIHRQHRLGHADQNERH